MSEVAFKIVDAGEWAAAKASGRYEGSEVDRADGYIHMSTMDQLQETARRHYAGRRDLWLVEVDLATLGEALVWEESRGGDLFPHIYGALTMESVRGERAMSVEDDGTVAFDDGAGL